MTWKLERICLCLLLTTAACGPARSFEPEFRIEYPIADYATMGPRWKQEVQDLKKHLGTAYAVVLRSPHVVVNRGQLSRWKRFQYRLAHPEAELRPGEVVAWIVVESDGKVSRALVIRSDQTRATDRRLLAETINGAKYSSLVMDGRPVPYVGLLTLTIPRDSRRPEFTIDWDRSGVGEVAYRRRAFIFTYQRTF